MRPRRAFETFASVLAKTGCAAKKPCVFQWFGSIRVGYWMVFLQNSAHNVLLQGSKANMRQPAAEAVGDAI